MNLRPLPIAQGKKNRSGLTVLEMLVAGSVASLVFAATAMLWVFSARSFVALGNYNDLDKASRNTLDIMSRDIRQTRALTAFTASSLTFLDYDSTPLRYIYNAGKRTLTREKGTQSTVLLSQCDYLNFDISQRNPSNNFGFYPATNAALAKLIDVSWKCSRTILGAKINTESVQTAKIVIRN